MIRLTAHAAEAMSLRAIDLAWVEAALTEPDARRADDRRAGVTLSFKSIAPYLWPRAAWRASDGRRRYSRDYSPFRQRSPAVIATTFDPDADAMFIRFAGPEVKSVRTETVAPGILLDVAEDGRMIAIEVLDVAERMAAHPRAA